MAFGGHLVTIECADATRHSHTEALDRCVTAFCCGSSSTAANYQGLPLCVHVSDFASAALIASSNTKRELPTYRADRLTAAHHWRDNSSLQSASADGENFTTRLSRGAVRADGRGTRSKFAYSLHHQHLVDICFSYIHTCPADTQGFFVEFSRKSR